MEHNNTLKRPICGVLAVVLALGCVPVPTRAEETAPVCEHHPIHTDDCGYMEAAAEVVCTHTHDESCNGGITSCVHAEHTDDCGYVEAEGEGSCTHTCTTGSGCITTGLTCGHKDDGTCCYVAAKEASPCNFECEICAAETPTPTCDCTAKCAEDAVNSDCDVCSTDYTKCGFEEEPETVEYGIYVGDTQITSDNAEDVLGDGTVSYDAETKTLTLKDADITESYTVEVGESSHTYGIYAPGDLTISTEGENTITAEDSTGEDGCSYGIHVTGTLTLGGEGTLTVTAGEAGENGSAYSIFCADISEEKSGELAVTGGYVIAENVNKTANQTGGVLTVDDATTVASDYALTEDMTLAGTWNFVNGAKLVPGEYTLTNNAAIQVNGEAHTHGETVTYVAVEGDPASHSKITACDGCPIGYTVTVTELHVGDETGRCACGVSLVAAAADVENGITLGETLNVEVGTGETVKIPFTPEYTHSYIFKSTGSVDTYGYLYDAAGNQLTYDDDGAGNRQFQITYTLIAGETYDLGVRYYSSSSSGTIPVVLTYGAHNYVKQESGEYVCGCGERPGGTCGANATWSFKDGVLTISGTGAMSDYSSGTSMPWYSLRNDITSVVIEDGVTSIGSCAFYNCSSLANADIPDSVTSIGSYAFLGCSSLESVEIPEGVTSIGNSAFYGCSSLESVDIPEGVTSIGSYTFYNCSSLTSVDIGDSVTSIGNYAFRGCSSLESVDIPDSVTTIGNDAFRGCSSLESVDIPDSVTSIGSSAFSGCSSLESVDIPDSVTSIGSSAFSSCSKLTSVDIGDSVTSIGDSAFASCSGIETIIWNAKDCETVSSNAFSNSNNLETVIIGEDVDHLSDSFWTAVSKTSELTFRGPNYFSMDAMPAGNSFGNILKDLPAGDYFADAQGALYRIENGTAVLVYCPPGVTALTVPEQLPAVDGTGPYPVTGVGSHALICAEDLESITFDAPENITRLTALAMANCPTLKSVNGKTSASEAKELFPKAKIGTNVFDNTGLTDAADGTLAGGPLTVTSTSGPSLVFGTTSGTYYTGETWETEINISNNDNSEPGHIVRVYLQFSDTDGTYSFQKDGTFFIRDKNSGIEYPVTIYKTDADTIVYYEFPQPNVGDTLTMTLKTSYPSPSSDGGTLKIWGVVLTGEEAEELGNGVPQPVEYLQSTWTTQKDTFPITKSKTGAASLTADSEGDVYVSKLSYSIGISQEGETLEGKGKDYMRSIEYTDVLTLPEGTSWDEDVLEAIQNGQYRIDRPTNYPYYGYYSFYYVTVNGAERQLCQLYKSSTPYPENGELSVENGNVLLKWKVTNPYSEEEMPLNNTTLTYGDNVIRVTDPDLTAGKEYTFTNNVTAVQHFTYSGDVTYEPEADNTITAAEADFTIVKTYSNYYAYMGAAYPWTITLTNNTALPYTQLIDVRDTLPNMYYIKPADLQAMFDADAADDEASLRITISNATLCEKVLTGTATGTDGAEHTLTNATTGADTEYHGRETTDSHITTKATLVLEWAEGEPLLQLFKDGELYGTIGEDGDYSSIEAALDSLHYLVTQNTSFTSVWTYEEGFTLKGGQSRTYQILSTLKDSFMYASTDVENAVINTSSTYSTTNYAYADYYTTSGGKTSKSDYEQGRYYRDFTLYKTVTRNGTAANSATKLEEGDLLRYQLSLDHDGTASYDALPLVDRLQGAQALLVPVEDNPDLGERYNLTVETIGESSWYVLDKVGTYENVIVGGYMTESVTVTATGSGWDTLIRWYLTGVSGNVTENIYYDALVCPSRTDGKIEAYWLYNEVWAGDHQSHRLWDDTPGLYFSYLNGEKSIVTDLGEMTPSDDVLADVAPVKEGDTVTYRFDLDGYERTPDSSTPYILTGENIYDALPLGIDGNFWSKEDITVRYAKADGTSLTVENGDSWYVTNTPPGGGTAGTQQYLCWSKDFSMEVDGKAYIYVTLTFPTEEEWQDYAARYANTWLENTLYVYGWADTVYHDLAVTGEAILQKGVYCTALTTSQSSYNYLRNTTENSRLYYVNDDTYDRLVLYYVTLYNSGEGRLYLNDLQDVLPEGFTFYKMHGGDFYSDSSNRLYDTGYTEYGTNGSTLASAQDSENKSVSWRYARVTPSTEMLESGRQKVAFSLTDYTGSTSYDLLYDEYVGKYYLAAGQGVKFAYACRTNAAADTEDIAQNRVAMAYYDHNGAGVTLPDNVTITGETLGVAAQNDGGCDILTNGTAESYGFSGGQSDTQWLSSDVTLRRGNIVPGITKAVADGNAYAEPDATVPWTVTVTNSGEFPIMDYTITDVMQSPYTFTGTVTYDVDYGSSSSYTEVQATLFTVKSRTDTTITLDPGYGSDSDKTLTIGGDPVRLQANVIVKYYNSSGSGTYVYPYVEVSVKKDENGNEVLAVRFLDGELALPESGTGVLTVNTSNDTKVYENKVYYNTSYITPNVQSYDESLVSQGNSTTLNEKPSVRNSCPITVTLGYITSSEKFVELAEDPSISASASGTPNFIALPEKDDLFTYTLQVVNAEKAMANLILIDNLPEVNDHSTFVNTDLRYSEFKVSLAENPNFVVTVTPKDGTATTLTSGQYRLEFSNKTEFSAQDWNGTSDWADAPSQNTRSFRVIISDPTGTLIPASATVSVRFVAKISGEAEPGQIAWNSFGYHYNLVGSYYDLEAAPLKVGVKAPSVPELKKQLKLEDGTAYEAEEDQTFRFLIHTGDALTLPDEYTEEELAASLAEAGRSYTYAELTVKKGYSVSDPLLMKDMVHYEFTDGKWTATAKPWDWVHGAEYTVIELPLSEDQEEFTYDSINGSASYTFTQNRAVKAILTGVNLRKTWDVKLIKTDFMTDEPLADAVFGLYSPNEADKISDADYGALELKSAPKKTIAVEGTTYYLSQVKASETNGEIAWTKLLRTKYYICELQAPGSYNLKKEPILVESEDYEDLADITVTNSKNYFVPETGGMGTFQYTISGAALIAVGVFLYGIMRMKRRKGVTAQ